MENSRQEASGFTIWVDADACPREARELIMRTAVRRCVRAVFVANSHLAVPHSAFISFILVPQGFDKADDHIVERGDGRDLAITGDIPLAARLIERDILVINTRGEEWTTANIGERLAMRNLMEELRSAGLATGGPKEFEPADRQRFANALDRFLTRRLKTL